MRMELQNTLKLRFFNRFESSKNELAEKLNGISLQYFNSAERIQQIYSFNSRYKKNIGQFTTYIFKNN